MMKKVLIISHNVIDERSAAGKTLFSFFNEWGSDKLAQIYFHSEIPTSHICEQYYRITDKDALRSICRPWKQKVGTSYHADDVKDDGRTSRTDSGLAGKLYSFGRKRTPPIYIARNIVWSLARYRKPDFIEWLQTFSPDVIFFAAGDYAFAYEITADIAQLLRIPVVMYCCDDYFINRVNPDAFLSGAVYKNLMKCVKKVISHTSSVITICDKMSDAYRKIFDVPVYTVHTGYSYRGTPSVNGKGIVYLGNLGFSRYESLVEIGKALKEINGKTGARYCLDVYSTEKRERVLCHLTEDNGIVFHRAVDRDEVRRIISESLMVVHTESFAEKNIYKTEYSVSTKVADLLASGHCILAYGPAKLASMEYLSSNHAAVVIDDQNKLTARLEGALADAEQRRNAIENAGRLAERNHAPSIVTGRIRKIIEGAGR